MSAKNVILSSLAGGVVIALLSNLPFLALVNCIMCAGIWSGAIFGVWVYKRMAGSVTVGQGTGIGALSGLWAGLVALVIGLLGAASAISAVNSALESAGVIDMLPAGFVESLMVGSNIGMIIINILFGTIGGLIGGALMKGKTETPYIAPPGYTPPPMPVERAPEPMPIAAPVVAEAEESVEAAPEVMEQAVEEAEEMVEAAPEEVESAVEEVAEEDKPSEEPPA